MRFRFSAILTVAALAACQDTQTVTEPATTTGGTTSGTPSNGGSNSSAIATVSVAFASSSLKPGETTQASAVARSANGAVASGQTPTWSSSNSAIATVSTAGVVKAIANGSATITASIQSVRGSAAITVQSQSSTPTAAPVASITASLSASSLLPGESAQASAVTRDASGNVLSGRVVTWSSSSPNTATVNSSGRVSGVAAGSALITATSEGKTGTATVTVQSAATPVPAPTPAPPPPTSAGSNEPAGLSLITQRSFNALGEGGWYDDNAPSKYSITQDATAPFSASSVGQQKFAAGMSGGGSPAVSEKGIGSRGTVYLSYWVKLSSNWYGHPGSGVNKQIFLWSDDQPTVYTSAQGEGSGKLSPEVRLQGSGGTTNLTPNLVPGAEFTRGVWHHWELVLVANTSGSSNGAADWWIDGVKVGSYKNVRFASGNGAWTLFQFSPIWGGTGGSVPADQFIWMDHIYISGK
jgi:hypothetical protein